MLYFEKPVYKITEYVENNFYGRFELEPLERGFGTTLGNALRRVMLSSLPGSAISSAKIEGVSHEFQALEGVVEDMALVLLNLKSIVVKNHSKETKTIRLYADKEGVVKASDIEHDADIEIINKDKHIATLSKGGKLEIEMTVSNGRGYVRSDETKKQLGNVKVGTMAMDAVYSPIERVSYEVEAARVGQNENYDKLVLDVWTNGSLKPEETLALASKILIEHFEILTNIDEIADISGLMVEKKEDPKVKLLEEKIEDLELSVRAYNALKRAGIHSLQDLVSKPEVEIMKVRNLGKTSFKEIKDKLIERNLGFADEGEYKEPREEAKPKEMKPENNADEEIEILGLGVRVYNALKAAKINTLSELTSKTVKEIKALPDLGETSFKELEEKLTNHKLQFKDEK